MKYNVHFMGYYCYDVVVEAKNKDEAREIAEQYTPTYDEYDYQSNGTDIWEADENDRITYQPNRKE